MFIDGFGSDDDENCDDDDDGDIYIMMKYLSVCLSRKIITSHFGLIIAMWRNFSLCILLQFMPFCC